MIDTKWYNRSINKERVDTFCEGELKMKYDYKFADRELDVLSALVGKRLDAYRLNDVDNSSFEIFVLRFPDVDIEFATREIVDLNEWFDETNTVEVCERRNRDSWSRVGKTEPDNGIPAGGFKDYTVGKTIKGVSAIYENFSNGTDSIEFVRGVILHFDGESILFDKGALNWENIWKVSCTAASHIEIIPAEFDPVEEAGLSSTTTIKLLNAQ